MDRLLLLLLAPLARAEDPCLTSRPADPGSGPGLPCVFPFTFNGTTYTGCTVAGHPEGLAWCSTATDSGGQHQAGGGHWAACGPDCPQEPECPTGWARVGPTGCYLLSPRARVRGEAAAWCQARGGDLLRLESEEETEVVRAWWEARRRKGQCGLEAVALWLGMQRKGEEDWVADDNPDLPIAYSGWYSSEPNNIGGAEECAAVMADAALAEATQTRNFGWIDLPCSVSEFPFMMKFHVSVWTVCERPVGPDMPTPALAPAPAPATGCLPGWAGLGTGCYSFLDRPGNAAEAAAACRAEGGYLAEVDSQQELELLEVEWRRVREERQGGCREKSAAYWVGASDRAEEGEWRLDRSGEHLAFTAWWEGEPNNYGAGGPGTGGEPGEDCAIIGFLDKFRWFDAPCGWRGNSDWEVSMFPLCEQLQGAELAAWREAWPAEEVRAEEGVEAAPSSLVEGAEGRAYAFLAPPGSPSSVQSPPPGLDRDNIYNLVKLIDQEGADAACRKLGGGLAEPATEEQWEELREVMEREWPVQARGVLATVLSWVWGPAPKEDLQYGWWLGASDRAEEGSWRWQGGANVSFSAWCHGCPWNWNIFSYGGADCLVAVNRQSFLGVTDQQLEQYIKKSNAKDDPDDEDWRAELEALEHDMLWVDVSCSATHIPGFNILLRPLCRL